MTSPPDPSLRARLDRLHHWLTLEGWTGTLAAAGYWVPTGLLAALLGTAAVAFVPYLLTALYAIGRPGWIVGFVGVVGVAGAAGAALGPPFGLYLALLAFYAYTWTLRLFVREWLRSAEEAIEWDRRQREWAEVTALHI
ncbi:hypothetical protein [Rubrivirga sp. IMCC43871]|uniref:hypothetical protein n=1 Tax=Rubrivirga sp. IMCC43871 TaxID=3391575 RepID=UPI00399015C2